MKRYATEEQVAQLLMEVDESDFPEDRYGPHTVWEELTLDMKEMYRKEARFLLSKASVVFTF